MADKQALVTARNIESKILTLRGQKVMLDADLAELYGVETKALNQAVKRNLERIPGRFHVSAHCRREGGGGHKL